MFTGIIHTKGTIKNKEQAPGEPLKLAIRVNEPTFLTAQRIGDSICVDGVCLSIVAMNIKDCTMDFHAIEQTCKLTTLARLDQNDSVHIEPSLNATSKIDGHFVTGHVDQTSKVLGIKKNPDGSRTLFIENKSPELIRLRGSIAINGVSLTVADVSQDYFCVCLIPITLEKTNFALLQEGSTVNLEYDLFLKSAHQKIKSAQEVIGQPIISDAHAMRIALQLAQLGRVTTPPNPWVGCVIVKNNIIVGAGYHERAGSAHAEIQALRSMKNPLDAIGAHMYVTLEPCCHVGRTGPCTKAIIAAGIAHVFVCVADPDSRVSGSGLRELNTQLISTTLGLLAHEGKKALKPYLVHRSTGKPFVIAKAGLSLDGKIAAQDGSSQWITDEDARAHAHQLRSECQAIMVGSGTVIKDNPRLSVRIPGYVGPQPMRVILDTYGTVRNPELAIFDQSQAKTCIFTSSECDQNALALWQEKHIPYYVVPAQNDMLDLNAIYKILGSMGIISLLIEGGSKILTHTIRTGLFHELYIYLGSVIIGKNGIPFFEDELGSNMAQAYTLKKREGTSHYTVFENEKQIITE